MKNSVSFDYDLTIDPDTVRLFILKARAISAGLNDDYDGGHEHEIEVDDLIRDGHRHDALSEEEAEDMTEEELRELIDDLNVDEAAELVAITWIGRGDYEAAEWQQAVEAAKARALSKTSKYLLGMPMLGDWLDEGLAAIGR
jgi:hypothetical protein